MSANKQLAIQFVNLNRPAALGIDNTEDFSLRFFSEPRRRTDHKRVELVVIWNGLQIILKSILLGLYVSRKIERTLTDYLWAPGGLKLKLALQQQ